MLNGPAKKALEDFLFMHADNLCRMAQCHFRHTPLLGLTSTKYAALRYRLASLFFGLKKPNAHHVFGHNSGQEVSNVICGDIGSVTFVLSLQLVQHPGGAKENGYQ